MPKTLLLPLSLLLASSLGLLAQSETEIVEEGKRLYKISLAVQHGAAVAKAKYPALKNASTGEAGYVSGDKSICVFYRSNPAQIILAISFDSQARIETANVDTKPREASLLEKDLFAISKEAAKEITTSSYKNYSNSHFTIIPVANSKSKRVYVVTTSDREGIITFGNDHLLSFNNDNKIIKRTPIHRNLMWTETQPKEAGKEAVEAWHTHLPETDASITSTDIYTLLMNEHLTKWKKYSVISETIVSIWNCETNKVTVVPKQKWELESKAIK